MRNLVRRYRLAIAFCLITITSTGCATYQLVDVELLEKNKNKTFKLGIVKAAGDEISFGWLSTGWLLAFKWKSHSSYFKYIEKAVDNIPTAEICALLSSQYSITIDANVDKTVRVDEEEIIKTYSFQRGTENNWRSRTEPITILKAQYGNSIDGKEFPDVVNVTYSFDYYQFGKLHYDIDIISSGQKIVTLHGRVRRNFLQIDNFDSYIENARRIGESLKRDLSDPANVRYIKPGDDLNSDQFNMTNRESGQSNSSTF